MLPVKREVIDPWAMRKEGKLYFDAAGFSLRQGFLLRRAFGGQVG